MNLFFPKTMYSQNGAAQARNEFEYGMMLAKGFSSVPVRQQPVPIRHLKTPDMPLPPVTEVPVPEEVIEPPPPDALPFKCSKCGKGFDSKNRLNGHNMRCKGK